MEQAQQISEAQIQLAELLSKVPVFTQTAETMIQTTATTKVSLDHISTKLDHISTEVGELINRLISREAGLSQERESNRVVHEETAPEKTQLLSRWWTSGTSSEKFRKLLWGLGILFALGLTYLWYKY